MFWVRLGNDVSKASPVLQPCKCFLTVFRGQLLLNYTFTNGSIACKHSLINAVIV